MISHFWSVTGRLIEYLQPPEETFRDASQLTFTCSLRPLEGLAFIQQEELVVQQNRHLEKLLPKASPKFQIGNRSRSRGEPGSHPSGWYPCSLHPQRPFLMSAVTIIVQQQRTFCCTASDWALWLLLFPEFPGIFQLRDADFYLKLSTDTVFSTTTILVLGRPDTLPVPFPFCQRCVHMAVVVRMFHTMSDVVYLC